MNSPQLKLPDLPSFVTTLHSSVEMVQVIYQITASSGHVEWADFLGIKVQYWYST